MDVLGTVFAGVGMMFAGVAAVIGYMTFVAKPKLRVELTPFSPSRESPGQYSTTLVIHNDGRKDANTATIRLCLPPDWGMSGVPEDTECHPGSPDSSLTGWSVFDLRIRGPVYSGRNERRYLRIAPPNVGDALPATIKWRAVYEGGSSPPGYYDLDVTYDEP